MGRLWTFRVSRVWNFLGGGAVCAETQMKMLGLYLEQQMNNALTMTCNLWTQRQKKYAFTFFQLNWPKSEFLSLSMVVNLLLGPIPLLAGRVRVLPGSYEPQSICSYWPLSWSVCHAWDMSVFAATKNCSLPGVGLPMQPSLPRALLLASTLLPLHSLLDRVLVPRKIFTPI